MAAAFTAQTVFNTHRDGLGLEWCAGWAGGGRPIELVSDAAREMPYVGYLNLIRPHLVPVLGRTELHYLASLDMDAQAATYAQLFAQSPALIVVADGEQAPALLCTAADQAAMPLFTSALSCERLINRLSIYVRGIFAPRITLHGVFMEVSHVGVLLTGASGVGKSELGLELIQRGHRLIADDAPEFSRLSPDRLQGSCPDLLCDFLEVRGLGILNIRIKFGEHALARDKRLELIIHLEPMGNERLSTMDRLDLSRDVMTILDVAIPRITLPVAPGRNLAILVEVAARHHALAQGGYDAQRDFQERQQRLMTEGG